MDEITELKRQLAEAIQQRDALMDAAGFCEEHQPSGGKRNCLVCGCLKLSYALARISYMLGEPNEMELSEYDVYGDEELVVEQARKRLKSVELEDI